MLLPEMWTGEAAPREIEMALGAIREICGDMGCFAVTGGMPHEENGVRLKRTWIVDDRGKVSSFSDKAHLSSSAGENDVYSPGEPRAIFSVGDTAAAAISSYDLMFPEYCRQLSLAGARIFFVSASWPAEYGHAWDFLIKGTAFLNQSFVAACNSAGDDAYFCGNSALVSPYGRLIGNLGTEEGVLDGIFRLSDIKKCSRDISAEHDRRNDIYRLLS